VRVPSKRAVVTNRMDALAKVAGRFEKWSPATEVLTRVKIVKTRFVQLNRATRLGGWPLQRIVLVHGPSGHGKTVLSHGIGQSFLEADGFYGFIDAEMTTPEDWITKLMGEELARHPGFVAMRPLSYEEVVAGVREFCLTIQEARDEGEIPESTPALVVVDSVRKLVPENLLAKILAEKGGVDGASGRGAMMKAALNGQWMDELVPLAYRANASILLIGRESENVEKKNEYAPDYKVQGGRAIYFDSSLVMRVSRDGWTEVGKTKDKPGTIIGERHRVRIVKTKLAALEGRHTDCMFYTSNGVMFPEGFDSCYDTLEIAKRLRIIEQEKGKGAHAYKGETIGKSEIEALKYLHAHPLVLAEIQESLVLGEGEVPSEAEEEAEAHDAAQPKEGDDPRLSAKPLREQLASAPPPATAPKTTRKKVTP
jgi:RecA/RadA recombinase